MTSLSSLTLALIWAALVGFATCGLPFLQESPKVFRRLGASNGLEKELEQLSSMSESDSIDRMRQVLGKAKGTDTVGGVTVNELLSLQDVSESKCNLDELARRKQYRKLNEQSAALKFIKHFDEKLADVCRGKGADLLQEALDITQTDKSIVEQVTKMLKDKSDLINSEAKESHKRQLLSEATKELAQDVVRLHDACKHLNDTWSLVRPFLKFPEATEESFNFEICSSFGEFSDAKLAVNKQVKVPKLPLWMIALAAGSAVGVLLPAYRLAQLGPGVWNGIGDAFEPI